MAAIIFDFDGTIADSFETVMNVFHELTGWRERLPAAEIKRLRGMSLLGVTEELRLPPWKVPFLVMRGRRRMTRQMRRIAVQPGVSEALRELYDEGHQLFIVSSNSPKNIRLFLHQHNLGKEFIELYGGVGLFGKARVLRRVLKRNQLDPRDTWYVGDEVRDITAAHHVGLHCAAVGWGFNTPALLGQHQPDRLIEQPAELLNLLQ
jgi:phosphoglycolate phosphatase-like HAD superfamily hydrolase